MTAERPDGDEPAGGFEMTELAEPKAEQLGGFARPQDRHLVMHCSDLPDDGHG